MRRDWATEFEQPALKQVVDDPEEGLLGERKTRDHFRTGNSGAALDLPQDVPFV